MVRVYKTLPAKSIDFGNDILPAMATQPPLKTERIQTLRPAGGWIFGAFVALNFILTLPALVFTGNDDSLYAVPNLLKPVEVLAEFELNLELTLLFAVWVFWAKNWRLAVKKSFWVGFQLVFWLALIYQSYANVLRGIYQLEPNFYNDLVFIRNGLPFFLTASAFPWWAYLAFISGLLGMGSLIGGVTYRLFVQIPIKNSRRTAQLLLVGLGIVGLWVGWISSRSSNPLNFLTVEVIRNINRSQETRQKVADLQIQNPFLTYDYAQYPLKNKPNIYLIFIESYGSVLATREHFLQPYANIMTEFGSQIAADGWHAVSTLSAAPTWGGGSWISYTAAMFGVDIAVQREYETLKADFQQIPYPHLGRYLQTQGYEFFWLAPIQLPLAPERAAADQNFFGADHWITFDSLDYAGPVYGWGPAPADQYSLGYAHEAAQSNGQPDFVVYLTQNSHYPYEDLPPILGDWRAFETLPADEAHTPPPTDRVFRQTRTDYLNAITYTFEMLAQFIREISDLNTIIVLMGDHQPPTVSYKGDGFLVPVHIISSDVGFLTQFEDFGFENGVLLSDRESALRHAGFYSVFVRNLVIQYGIDPASLPPYLPNGMGE